MMKQELLCLVGVRNHGDGGMAMEENPYEPPQSDLAAEQTLQLTYEQAVEIRQHHLSAEKSYKWLAITVAVVSIHSPAFTWKLLEIDQALTLGTISLFVQTMIAVPMLIVAFGLYHLQPSARDWATALAYFGLLGLPIFTLLSLLLFRALNSPQGAFLYSPYYCRVRALTPKLDQPHNFWNLAIICFGSIIGAGMLLYF
jgi:hypothetical protein